MTGSPPRLPTKFALLLLAAAAVLPPATAALSQTEAPGTTQAAVPAWPSLRVRVGEHAGFNRVAFDWPERVPYRVEVLPDSATVHFDRPASLDLSHYRTARPPLLHRIEPRRGDGTLAVRIAIPRGAEVRHFELGSKVVVDVLAPGAAGATQQAARPVPAAVPAPAPARPKPVSRAEPVKVTKAAPAREAAPAPAGEPQAFNEPRTAEEPEAAPLAIEEPPAAETQIASTEPQGAAAPPEETDDERDDAWQTAMADLPRPSSTVRGFSLGPNVSTLGLGGEVGYRFNDYVGIRLGGNYFDYDFDDDISNVDYDVDVTLASAGAVLDLYPFGGGFRMTGGLRYNDNDLDLRARPSNNVRIGGRTFTPAEVGTLRGDIDFWDYAPYAGLGYQAGFLDGHLQLAFDLGVMFQGRPDVDLTANGAAAGSDAFRSALDREVGDIEDDIDLLRFYPVAGLSLTYRF